MGSQFDFRFGNNDSIHANVHNRCHSRYPRIINFFCFCQVSDIFRNRVDKIENVFRDYINTLSRWSVFIILQILSRKLLDQNFYVNCKHKIFISCLSRRAVV